MKKGLKGKTTIERTTTGDMPGKPMPAKPAKAKLAPKKLGMKDRPF